MGSHAGEGATAGLARSRAALPSIQAATLNCRLHGAAALRSRRLPSLARRPAHATDPHFGRGCHETRDNRGARHQASAACSRALAKTRAAASASPPGLERNPRRRTPAACAGRDRARGSIGASRNRSRAWPLPLRIQLARFARGRRAHTRLRYRHGAGVLDPDRLRHGCTSAAKGRPTLFREVERRATAHPRCRIVGKPSEGWKDANDDLAIRTSRSPDRSGGRCRLRQQPPSRHDHVERRTSNV